MMRVLFDTNILISNLLSPRATTSATGVVIQAAIDQLFVLFLLDGVVEELDRKLSQRPDLAARIPRSDALSLVRGLAAVAEPIPYLPEPYPEVGRDRKDDFLIAHGIVAGAQFLVTWDKDLLDLVVVGHMRIVSPPEFLDVLRAEGLP